MEVNPIPCHGWIRNAGGIVLPKKSTTQFNHAYVDHGYDRFFTAI